MGKTSQTDIGADIRFLKTLTDLIGITKNQLIF
jgi:hypothetical protein